ncbi:protein Son-like isoform X2 [Liolophura sinensis]|uniref:protein Son-like isoform X2 n=1 Tax=Liolophura sinensis TaxID=3198878 RepID=UPI003159141E
MEGNELKKIPLTEMKTDYDRSTKTLHELKKEPNESSGSSATVSSDNGKEGRVHVPSAETSKGDYSDRAKHSELLHIGESIKERIKAEMKASVIKGPRSQEDERTRSDIVDEMFRDFLAEKMELVEKEYVRKRKLDDSTKTTSVSEETACQKKSKRDSDSLVRDTKHKLKESKSKSSQSKRTSKSVSSVDDQNAGVDLPSEAKVHVRAMTMALRNLAETDPFETASSGTEKYAPVATTAAVPSTVQPAHQTVGSGLTEGKKPVLPLKISSASASRILSGETTVPEANRKKQLEEGEVMSSGTDDTTDDDSDEGEDANGKNDKDGEPSETGSISDSDAEKTSTSKPKKKKKKHKHKHKHKKKKKKSSKSSKTKKKKSARSRSRSLSPRIRKHSRTRSPSPGRYRDRSPLMSDSKWVAETGKPIGLLSRSYRERHGLSDSKCSRRETRERSRGRDRHDDDVREKRRDSELQIDKAKLRKIAIANAVSMMKTGGSGQASLGSDTLVKLKAGGKSVEELTDYCKKISDRDRERQLHRLQNADDSLSDSSEDYEGGAKSEEEDFTVHHPFTVKEAPNIVMNIRNSKQLPTLTPQEKVTESAKLRLTFPVSSGSQHRAKESEWVPVEKTTAAAATTTTAVITTITKPSTASVPQTITQTTDSVTPAATTTTITTAAEAAVEVATVTAQDKVFPDPPKMPMDIGRIVSERLAAVRRLQQNPNDVQAISQMHTAQKKASLWAESKVLPGQFMGSTGATIMSQQELMGPDKKRQAWARKIRFVVELVCQLYDLYQLHPFSACQTSDKHFLRSS